MSASSSADTGNDGADGSHRLWFDYGFSYIGTELDIRRQPRLPLYVPRPDAEDELIGLEPILDTSAEHTIFDGSLVEAFGWTERDIVARAEAWRLVYGLAEGGQPLTGYLHRLRCLIPLGHRFADLTLRVLLTTPNTLATPVLGRQDFLSRVDFALLDAEQRFYLRFRDRSTLRAS